MLANGIELPMLLGLGCGALVAFAILNSLVSLVESVALRSFLGLRVRRSFARIFWANMLSAFIGGFLYLFQDKAVDLLGVRTLYDFSRFYLWVAVGFVLVYYAVSVLIEGLVLSRSRVAELWKRTPRQLWKGVALANAASYLLLAPFFYLQTRPSLDGAEMVSSLATVAACRDRILYLGEAGRACAIRADGTERRVLGGSSSLISKFREGDESLSPHEQGELVLNTYRMEITRGGDPVMRLPSPYHGIILIRGIGRGAFLSSPGKVVFQEGRFIYVADTATRRVAPLVEGEFQGVVPDRFGEPDDTDDNKGNSPAGTLPSAG